MEIENKTGAAPHEVGKSNSLVVIVGDHGFLQTSDDGASFKDASSFLPTENLSAIAWSEKKKLFVCLGVDEQGQGFSYISKDGKDWGEKSYSSTSSYARRILWNDTCNFFIAVGNNGIIEISSDGMDWERIPLPDVNANLHGLLWNEEAQEFVVVGDRVVLTSQKGRVWIPIIMEFQLRDVAWNGQQYIAVTASKKVFFSSADGKEWTKKIDTNLKNPSSAILWCKQFNSYYITGEFASIYASTHGEEWKEKWEASVGMLNHKITTIIWSQGLNKLIAADQDGYLYSSTSGQNWTVDNIAKDNTAINSVVEAW